jgi:hypothetical protein
MSISQGYLCQVNDQLSCGTCCGLYNIEKLNREHLQDLLFERTERFSRVPRDMESILIFKREIESLESQNRPDSGMHHCPFVGLIGDTMSTVGCLLHPLSPANKKIDFRGLSFWGGLACSSYFCLSHRDLPVVYKQILKKAIDDWYLYGLVVTEKDMIGEFFTAVETASGRNLEKSDWEDNEDFLDTVKAFFELKRNWPYRPDANTDICNFSFGANPDESPLGSKLADKKISIPFPAILKALNTNVETDSELEVCIRQIEELVQNAAGAI